MRKAEINPCLRKGEVSTYKTQANAYASGVNLRYGACECLYALRSTCPGGQKLSYGLKYDPPEDAGRTIDVKNSRHVPEGSILTVPCSEQFREHDSKGTLLYKKIAGRSTKFKGCQAVEEYLTQRQLVRLWIHDRETLQLSDLLDKVAPREEDYFLPINKETKQTLAESVGFRTELGIDEKKWSLNKIASQANFSITHSFADFIRTSPGNYRQATARKLYEDGHWRHIEKESPKRLALFFLSENITDPQLILKLVPTLDYAKYKVFEGCANALIDAHLPEQAKIFKAFMKTLTDAQREAVEKVYLHNDEGDSHRQIADKIGITFDSLRDRLSGVKKKLVKAFPDFELKKRKTFRPSIPEPRPTPNGMLVTHDEVLVTRIDPRTGIRSELIVKKSPKGRIHYKSGVNPFEIRRRIREMRPIPYPVI